MAQQQFVSNIQPTGVQSETSPNTARQSIPFNIPLANASAAFDYLFDFQLAQAQYQFDAVRTMFADNSLNPSSLLVAVSGSLQQFPIPPFSAGYFNVSSSTQSKQIEVTSVGGATGKVYLEFYNYEIAPDVWTGFAPFIPGISVTTKPAVGAPTPRNFVLVGGTAHNVFPAVTTPNQKRFRNFGGGSAWYNMSVTADGTAANGDIPIQPGEPMYLLPYSFSGAISFYSAVGTTIIAEDF